MSTIMSTLEDIITGLNKLFGLVASVNDRFGNVEWSINVQGEKIVAAHAE